MIVIALLGLACNGDDKDSDTPTDSMDGLTGSATSCVIDPQNGLRVTCTAVLEASATATLTLSASGEAERVFSSDDAIEHSLLAWGLVPETDYTWSLAGESGVLTTGSVPVEFAALDVTVSGTPRGFDAVLLPLPCGGVQYFAMFDGQGRLVWYEQADLYAEGGRGYEWSHADRTLLYTTTDLLLEIDPGGQERLRLEQGTHFEHELHHDVSRWGDFTYLLLEYTEGGLQLDQVDVLDGTTRLGSWRLADTYDVDANPSNRGEEWSHGNALNVNQEGEAIFSSLSFDAVVAFDADPASPTFLAHRWLASGSITSLPNPDYTPTTSSSGFSQQHAAHRVDDSLTLFDNAGRDNHSRGIRLDMNHDKGTLTLVEEWPLGGLCLAQGGAYPLADGGVLTTCAISGEIWAFSAGSTLPDWQLNAWCEPGAETKIRFPKGIPIVIE